MLPSINRGWEMKWTFLYREKITEVHLFQKDILSLRSEDSSTWNSFAVIKYLYCYTKVKSNSMNLWKIFKKPYIYFSKDKEAECSKT